MIVFALRVVDQADRQREVQLAALGRVTLGALQTHTHDVQLGLRELAFDAQHELIVEVTQVIDPVCVDHQRVGQPAVLKQPLGLGARARQPRDLQPEDRAHLAQAHAADQLLVGPARVSVAAREAEIPVDGQDPLRAPSRAGPPPPRARTGARSSGSSRAPAAARTGAGRSPPGAPGVSSRSSAQSSASLSARNAAPSMFATTQAASAPMPATAHHRSARRLSSSRLTCEISNISASPCAASPPHARRRSQPAPCGTYTIRLRPELYTVRYAVRAVQLATPAATALARATPHVRDQRAAQRQRRIATAGRQPLPQRIQLALCEL